MQRMKIIGIGWLAGLLLLGCQSTASNVETSSKTAEWPLMAQHSEGFPLFPDFTVKGFDGTEKALKDYRGKIVILDLFATWCPPCRMEIPHFVELQEKYKDILAVVGLSYDQVSADKVKAFAKKMKINYDLYWGSEEIAEHVGLRGIPHTLVIDPQGHVVRSYVGYRDKSVFEKDILSLQASQD